MGRLRVLDRSTGISSLIYGSDDRRDDPSPIEEVMGVVEGPEHCVVMRRASCFSYSRDMAAKSSIWSCIRNEPGG